MTLELVHQLATSDAPADQEDPRQRHLPARAQPESGRPDHGDRLVQQESRHAVRVEPAALPLPSVCRARQQPRHVHVHAERKRVHGAAGVARLAAGGVARRAPDGQQRRAHLRDAGHRSDQSQRAPAHLPVERDSRPVTGGGARSGRQDRHHLQLHLHQLLAGRDGLERLVAQPDRSAHRDRERAHRRAGDAAARAGRPLQSGAARRQWRPAQVHQRAADAADRHAGAHRISAALAGRTLDAARHRRLSADLDAGAARNGGGSARDAAAPDLRGQPLDRGRCPAGRCARHRHSDRGPARPA